jgi:hypothetical protein
MGENSIAGDIPGQFIANICCKKNKILISGKLEIIHLYKILNYGYNI